MGTSEAEDRSTQLLSAVLTRTPETGTAMTEDNSNDASEASEFEDLAQEQQPGLLEEIWTFMKEEKIWWMSPIILALLLVGLLVALTSTGAAPFIYTLF